MTFTDIKAKAGPVSASDSGICGAPLCVSRGTLTRLTTAGFLRTSGGWAGRTAETIVWGRILRHLQLTHIWVFMTFS